MARPSMHLAGLSSRQATMPKGPAMRVQPRQSAAAASRPRAAAASRPGHVTPPKATSPKSAGAVNAASVLSDETESPTNTREQEQEIKAFNRAMTRELADTQAQYFAELLQGRRAVALAPTGARQPLCGAGGGVALLLRLGVPAAHVAGGGADETARIAKYVVSELAPAFAPSLTEEDGYARVRFPLQSFTPCGGLCVVDDVTEEAAAAMLAMVDALDEVAETESVVSLMEKGSDDRSVFAGLERRNKYHTGMRPLPDGAVHRASCTSSNPTPGALSAAVEAARALWEAADADSTAGSLAAAAHAMQRSRQRLADALCGADADSAAVFSFPSGTDAESLPLLRAVLMARNRRRAAGEAPELASVVSVVSCDGEVGGGTPGAASGRYFSALTPLDGADYGYDTPVVVGDHIGGGALAGLCSCEASRLPARMGDAGAFDAADYDARVEAAAREALSGGADVVVLHVIAGSKTGLCAPSESCIDRLAAEFGEERVVSVLDCCQMRHDENLLPRWVLERPGGAGGVALVTASKFFAGPSFAGAVVASAEWAAALDADLAAEPAPARAAVAAAVGRYLTRDDVGDAAPALAEALPERPCNVGLLLRWACGLHEMERVGAAVSAENGSGRAAEAVRTWVSANRTEAEAHAPYLHPIRAPNMSEAAERADVSEGMTEHQRGGVCSIVSTRLRPHEGAPYLTAAQLKEVYGLMYDGKAAEALPAEATAAEREACGVRALLGQPVDIAGGAVLRSCMSAPQLSDILEAGGDAAAAAERQVAVDDSRVLKKLAILAKYSEHFLTA